MCGEHYPAFDVQVVAERGTDALHPFEDAQRLRLCDGGTQLNVRVGDDAVEQGYMIDGQGLGERARCHPPLAQRSQVVSVDTGAPARPAPVHPSSPLRRLRWIAIIVRAATSRFSALIPPPS